MMVSSLGGSFSFGCLCRCRCARLLLLFLLGFGCGLRLSISGGCWCGLLLRLGAFVFSFGLLGRLLSGRSSRQLALLLGRCGLVRNSYRQHRRDLHSVHS